MTPETFDKILREAGITLPAKELQAAFPAAMRLLEVANQLPEPRRD